MVSVRAGRWSSGGVDRRGRVGRPERVRAQAALDVGDGDEPDGVTGRVDRYSASDAMELGPP